MRAIAVMNKKDLSILGDQVLHVLKELPGPRQEVTHVNSAVLFSG